MIILARFAGRCTECNGKISRGEEIEWSRDRTALRPKSFHLRCWAPPRVGPSLSDLECAEDFLRLALTSGPPLMRVMQERILIINRGWKIERDER